ncbi:MAG TPA: dockerin type I domain-containing protein, partial [Phycisphaerae bacterium]|nr:dockerin type I domain-containing protein [Phycisphaerae bacterium]
VGLSVSTERSGESRFRSKTNPLVETKDRSFALAIAVCADWIVAITGTVEPVAEPEPEPATAVLVVVGGTGGGQYTVGSMVSIVADVPVGCKFIQWTGDVAMVDDVWNSRTTVVVDDNATITAVCGPDHSLNVTATLDTTWVYQNSPATRGRHGAVLTLAVEDSGESSGPYQVMVTQSGDGDQVALAPTDDPLVWLVLGGTARQALPGEVTLTVSVTDATGECCAETSCSLNVRLLGDVNADGIVDGQDVSAIVHVLNGRAGAGYDRRVFDLDVNGGVEPTDMSILIYSMNGATVSVRGG